MFTYGPVAIVPWGSCDSLSTSPFQTSTLKEVQATLHSLAAGTGLAAFIGSDTNRAGSNQAVTNWLALS